MKEKYNAEANIKLSNVV